MKHRDWRATTSWRAGELLLDGELAREYLAYNSEENWVERRKLEGGLVDQEPGPGTISHNYRVENLVATNLINIKEEKGKLVTEEEV